MNDLSECGTKQEGTAIYHLVSVWTICLKVGRNKTGAQSTMWFVYGRLDVGLNKKGAQSTMWLVYGRSV